MVKKIGVVDQANYQPFLLLPGIQGQIELRRVLGQPSHLYRKAGERDPGIFEVEHVKEDRRERLAAQVAFGLQFFNKLFKRQVLMSICAERSLAHTPHSFSKTRIAG